MDETQCLHDFLQLTIDQIRELATAVFDDFGGDLSRAAFTEKLLLLLEDVPGFEAGKVEERFIELEWTAYSGCPPNS
ncbi:hypothetical protein DIE18_26260 [Burkholderia sp. Bp9125]|nr:hypothetical protein DIE18_26260 [Burkholderia sp. Bp9125]